MSLELKDIYHQEEVEGYIFEKNVTIPRVTGEAAGNVLRVNVYRPPAPGEYPVIVTYGPYGKDWHYSTFAGPSYAAISESQKSVHSSWETPSPKYWTAHGYAVVRADEGGIGQSPGKMNVISRQTVDGFFDVIQWAAEQPWSSGKVGLLGLSYYAATQWMVAARHPKGLEAMIPWEGFSDVYRECARHGGIASNGFLEWWYNNSLRGNQYGYPTPEENPGRPSTEEGKLSVEELAEKRVVIYDAVAENEFADEAFNAEKEFNLADINTPFLSVANWGGVTLHLRGNVRAFTFASSPLKYIRFIVGRHDLPFYYEEEVENQRSFLDAFLKGEDAHGWTTPGKIPPIDLVVRKGDPAVANVAEEQETFQRRAEWEWPLARTEYQKWFLAPAGGLATTEPDTDQKIFEYVAPEGAIEFSSPPFDADVEITGHPILRIGVSLASRDGSTPTDIDIFATLRHFNAKGKEVFYTGSFAEPTPIVKGWLRVSHLAIDETHPQHRPWLPRHLHTTTTNSSIKLDTVYTATVEFWPTNVVIEKGGRLVLEIAASDDPTIIDGVQKKDAHPPVGLWTHNDPRDRPLHKFQGLNRVHTGNGFESWLVLPVIPSP